MVKKICTYCGTEYDSNMERCPLCGSINEELSGEREPEEEAQRPARRRGGARVAPREDKIPKWLSVLICVILGMAVVIGAVFALYSLGLFSGGKDPGVSSVSLPLSGEETNADTSAQNDTQSQPDTQVDDCIALTLNTDQVRIDSIGETYQVMASVEPEGYAGKLTWSSSDTSVCTVDNVDNTGLITAVGIGSTKVTVQCGSHRASCSVSCGDMMETETQAEDTTAPNTSNDASLSATDFTLFSVGETAKITVNGAPSGASVTWSSSNNSVATVSGGTVTAVKSGTATVTADVNGKKLECTVRCRIEGLAPATSENAESTGGKYALDHSDVTLSVGESFEISVVDGVSGGWNVSDGSVCTVDAKGIVTGVGSGTATVFTTVGGQRLECIVRVN